MHPARSTGTIAARLGAALVIGTVIGPMNAVGVLADPGAEPAADQTGADRSRLDRLGRQIEAGRERQRLLGGRTARLDAEVRDLKRRLVAAAAAVQLEEGRMIDLEGRLDELASAEHETVGKLRRHRREISASLGALTRLSRLPTPALIVSAAGATDTFRSSILLRTVVGDLERLSKTLRGQLVALGTVRTEIREKRRAHETALAALGDKRRRLDRLVGDRARAKDRTLARRERERRRMAKLAAEARDLRSLLGRIREAKAKAAARRAIEQAAARRAAKRAIADRREAEQPADDRLAAGSTADDGLLLAPANLPAGPGPLAQIAPPAPDRSFRRNRGRLPLPARGRVIGRFGWPDAAGTPAKGITIETRRGAAVISPNDGEVVFAGPFRGYGELLIIALGDGYHILLAGLTRTDVSVGQWLLAGEPVGIMADHQGGIEGGSPPQLYVELRRRGEPVNPLQWMTADKRKASG